MIDGIEQNPKLGCYIVGDRVFYSKPQAHIYATETDQPVRWQFNDVAFAKYNWNAEPPGTINDIYRQRAQQLREKYDYIRIECSGGGDSTTAVYSFLLNGIHLDEIVFRYPAQVDKNVTDNPLDTSPENTLSEFQFAAKPLLHWVKTNYPKTKVTIHDYSEKMLAEEKTRDESWVFTARDWFQPGHGNKHDHFSSAEHRALNDSGKSICVLHGVDKPKLAILDNNWYLFFTDMHPNGPTPIQNGYTNITTELFYWTPDMPEICAKQAHIIRRWFDMPQNQHLKHIIHHANVNADQRTTYENLIKTIIYPDYDPATWQTAKPTNSFYNEMDHWFYTNLKGTRLYTAWERGLEFLVDKIDKKYFVNKLGKPTGLILYRSMLYHIGAENTEPLGRPVFKNSSYLSEYKDFHYIVKDRKLKKVDK